MDINNYDESNEIILRNEKEHNTKVAPANNIN